MFIEDADMTCLRQGDVLKGIPFPLIRPQDLCVLGSVIDEGRSHSQAPTLVAATHKHRDDPYWLKAQMQVRLSFCAVLSQCCDLELKHGRFQMPAFAVARLVRIPKSILDSSEKLASLSANKDPRDPKDPGYINFFYMPLRASLENQEWIVDYNQTLCIPGSEFSAVLKKKILQMDDRSRMKFKIKLAASFGRPTDEEIAAGLENPWSSTGSA